MMTTDRVEAASTRRSAMWLGSTLALLIAAGVAPAQSVAGCRAVPPAEIAGGVATWLGPCLDGAADGVGTLRVARRDGPPRLFHGRMVRGRPFSGVIWIRAGGFGLAWRFDAQLRPVNDPSGNMQSSIDTLDLAAAGAMEASRRYRAQGNMAAARFYAKQSDEIANQID